MTADEIAELTGYLTPAEREELEALIVADISDRPWVPLPGPQTMAYESTADVIGFGGAAGGGKTDLACGKALTQHRVVQIFRREGTELTAIIDRMSEIVGSRDGLGGKPPIWREPPGARARVIEFGSVPNLGDERKFQGRAKDLLVIDEAANFLEAQVRFLMGWVRSVDPDVRTQTLLTFNPPTNAEGRWVIRFFAPWLDRKFVGKRAAPGEIRYVGVVPGENGVSRDIWVDDARPFVIRNGEPCYDFDPARYSAVDIVKPQSRTFIPSRITDNPFLVGTGYLATLQAMPEPLRSQMLYGDFAAGMEDDAFQVVPTAWVERAMDRWTDRSPKGEMTGMGVDVARGGKDNTVLAFKHGNWIDKVKRLPGTGTPDGQSVVGQVVAHRRDACPVMVDGIGVGAAVYDLLREVPVQTVSVNVAERSTYHGRAGNLHFANLRSELWWRLREWLDPANDTGAALPPDPELLAEICAPQWCMRGKQIYVESREEIIDRIGRSPDAATAVILALIDTPNEAKMRRTADARKQAHFDPIEAHANQRAPVGDTSPYDPLASF